MMVKSVNYETVSHKFESAEAFIMFIIFSFPKHFKTFLGQKNIIKFENFKALKVFCL